MKKPIYFLVIILIIITANYAHAAIVFDTNIDIYGVYDVDVIDIKETAIVNLFEPGYLGLQVNLEGSPTLNVFGGEVVYINTFGGIVNFYGGTISGNIAYHGGEYNVYG